jgi:hypothetical protein
MPRDLYVADLPANTITVYAPSAADIEQATANWLTAVQAGCPEGYSALAASPPRATKSAAARWRLAALGGSLAFGWVGRKAVRTLEKADNRDRAGGLPGSFVLVVTPQTVRAYESTSRSGGSPMGGQAAGWDRSGLEVIDVERGAIKTTVRLRVPDGEEISCSAGTHEYTDTFLELHQTAPVQ